MSTICSKFVPEFKKEQANSSKEVIAILPTNVSNDSIKESSISIGVGESLPENTQTLNQLNFPLYVGNAKANREKQRLQKERLKELRQHTFQFGSDPRESNSLNQSSFIAYSRDEYINNKKDIVGIGKSHSQNNWFRSNEDLEDWKKNQLQTEMQREFISKPVTNPEIIAQQRKNLKIANTTQHFSYGFETEPTLQTSYREMCSSNKSIDSKERSIRRNQIAKQRLILSKSSYIHGDPENDSFKDVSSSYNLTIGKDTPPNELILKDKLAVREMKDRIQKTSVVLGTDPINYTSEYKNTHPKFSYASNS